MTAKPELLVVDAANVVGSVPDGWWRDRAGAAARLRDALQPVAETGLPDARPPVRPPVEVALVVEGAARGIPEVPGVRVVRAAGSGDDAIVELTKAECRDRPCTVVTADRALRERVRTLGAEVLGPRSLPRWSTRPGHRGDDEEIEVFPQPRRADRTGGDTRAAEIDDEVPARRRRRVSARRPRPSGEPDRPEATEASPAGVLFDVDGTLVDTTYLHTVTWWEAMRQSGRVVPMARIHRTVGMGADNILDHLLGADRDRADDDAMTSAHTALYGTYWDRLAPLPGAVELLHACAGRGLRIALASSASAKELAALRAALDADDVISVATSADDAGRSKPAPDVLIAALRRAGLDAARVVLVGDSVWDILAASQLDIPCVALTCGGTSAAELSEAGAAAVYADPAELLAALDESPIGKLG